MATKKRQGYITMTSIVTVPGWFQVERKCNGFMITNVGDRTVTVNDMILYPGTPGTLLGDSRTVGGNQDEEYLGRFYIVFSGVGVAPAVEIVQKLFVDEET